MGSDTTGSENTTTADASRRQLQLLDEALNDGQLGKALKIHGRLQKCHVDDRRRLSKLTNRLKALEDWQVYATNPKREDLCRAMASVAASTDSRPEHRIREIKRLHKEWQQLGPSNSPEGQKLWSRFRSASDKAYQLCSEQFGVRDARRKQNQLASISICESLESFLQTTDWQTVNYRRLTGLIADSQTQWRTSNDIPHSAIKPLNARFNSALAQLRQHLSEEQARNASLKQGLIEQLQQFLDSSSGNELVSETKRLQQQWKKIGITHRGTDQRLWKSFRKLCDEVFARQDTERKNQKRSAQNAKQHQLDFIEELKRKAAICCQLEQRTIDEDQAEASWPGKPALPADLEEALLTRRKAQNCMTAEMIADAERICIEAELLAELDSPESCQQARMQLKMIRMERELSSGLRENRSTAEQLRHLQVTFYCLPLGSGHHSLHDRFTRAETALSDSPRRR
jgi:hypothetical protein